MFEFLLDVMRYVFIGGLLFALVAYVSLFAIGYALDRDRPEPPSH
ncbi:MULTISPECIES: hypothetical protein [Pseudomonas syringae group]|uniref:Uncharacterized protein n=1 Tax=Pseudomonas syringae pv. coriandricola TaxID=264453 RepID=A0A3M3JEX3_9PSED|nr:MULTISPECIES: hypothetical protein [Pseudomonas syringae group]RMN08831.1 hypothetical protein ALQ65_200094 [Pseudomonas syringae pv. coriandricola]